jgi:hypothetical protein
MTIRRKIRRAWSACPTRRQRSTRHRQPSRWTRARRFIGVCTFPPAAARSPRGLTACQSLGAGHAWNSRRATRPGSCSRRPLAGAATWPPLARGGSDFSRVLPPFAARARAVGRGAVAQCRRSRSSNAHIYRPTSSRFAARLFPTEWRHSLWHRGSVSSHSYSPAPPFRRARRCLTRRLAPIPSPAEPEPCFGPAAPG